MMEEDAPTTVVLDVSAYAVRGFVIPNKKSVRMSALVTLG